MPTHLFDHRTEQRESRAAWLGSVAVHAVLFAGLAYLSWTTLGRGAAKHGRDEGPMVLGLSEATMNGIWMLPFYLIAGELDRLFVYPVRSLPFVLISRPELHSLGNFASGAVAVGVAWSMAPPPAAAFALLPV